MPLPALQENEIITLVIGCGILSFILINLKIFQKIIPRFSLLFLSFLAIFFSEVFTNIEALIWPNTLNILEHAGYAVSIGLLALWCCLVLSKQKGTA